MLCVKQKRFAGTALRRKGKCPFRGLPQDHFLYFIKNISHFVHILRTCNAFSDGTGGIIVIKMTETGGI